MITRKVSDVDHVIASPNRGKLQMICHINMLKECQDRTPSTSATVTEQPLVISNCVIQDLDLNSSEKEVRQCNGMEEFRYIK